MTQTRKYLVAAVVILALIWIISLMTGGKKTPAQSSRSISSAGQAQGGAATQPADSVLLPGDYAVLESRNPFGRGHGHGARAGGPDATFVFEGTIQSGNGFTAFVENMAAKSVIQVAVGDAVARGRVKSIDLDALEYEVAGNNRRIEVGQNLNGETPPPPPPPASKPTAPPMPGPGGPQQMPPGMPMPPPGVQVQMNPGG
jgi:hypothetical protein